MDDYDHYLITRFNLKMNHSWKTNPKHLLTPEWIEYRLNILKLFTISSVKNQTCKKFKYIILVDRKTDNMYLEELKKLDIFYKIFFIDDSFGFSRNCEQPKLLAKFIENDSTKKYVITSNLDSDDSIHFDYINTIQKLFNYQINTIINFPCSYEYYLVLKRFLKKRYLFNTFVNLIEKRDTVKTCFYCGHTELNNFDFDFEFIENRYYCSLNVHSLNDSSKINFNTIANLAINTDLILKNFNYPML